MNSLARSKPFFEALNSADVVLRDGSGMASLFRFLKLKPGLNLNGTDLIPLLIERFDGRPVAFFGTQEPYLTRGVASAKAVHAPRSEFTFADGFRDVAGYVEQAMDGRPALIILGMGMPKQELVAVELRTRINWPCLVICGGAIIDFLGGRTPRAPKWVRRSGLEWAFRLGMEPKRLFHRYVIGNPLFLVRAWLLASTRTKS